MVKSQLFCASSLHVRSPRSKPKRTLQENGLAGGEYLGGVRYMRSSSKLFWHLMFRSFFPGYSLHTSMKHLLPIGAVVDGARDPTVGVGRVLTILALNLKHVLQLVSRFCPFPLYTLVEPLMGWVFCITMHYIIKGGCTREYIGEYSRAYEGESRTLDPEP